MVVVVVVVVVVECRREGELYWERGEVHVGRRVRKIYSFGDRDGRDTESMYRVVIMTPADMDIDNVWS